MCLLMATGGPVYAFGSQYSAVVTAASLHGLSSSFICIAGKFTRIRFTHLHVAYAWFACSLFKDMGTEMHRV